MSTSAVDITILCVCGQPASAPVHQGGGHKYQPMRGADQVRDDQTIARGNRRGHYSIEQQRVVQVANPAAGVDISVTVPATSQWEVISLQATLTTGAAIGNRVPHIVISDALGHAVYNVPAVNNQAAASVKTYSAGAAIAPSDFDNSAVLVLPYGLVLLQGWVLSTLTTALQAADQWILGNILVEEWLDF
jgi:hypothetical protein